MINMLYQFKQTIEQSFQDGFGNYLKNLFGDQYPKRFGNGTYVLVDRENVLYAPYGETLYGLALVDPKRPDAGIAPRYRLDDVINKFQGGSAPAGTGRSADPTPPPSTMGYAVFPEASPCWPP